MVRKIALLVAGFLCLAVVAFLVLPPQLQVSIQRLVPQTISWDSKLAWAKCETALSGWDVWPRSPKDRCRALSLCLNEASLATAAADHVSAMMRDLPDCYEP